MPGGRVRKQNVSACRTGERVERRVGREVSPGAGAGTGDGMIKRFEGG